MELTSGSFFSGFDFFADFDFFVGFAFFVGFDGSCGGWGAEPSPVEEGA